jgi:hypothetical protein
MTEHDRDEGLSRRYRELAREEPPRALDEAILAAARREVEARPAPLVAPTGRRRWFVPVAAAAVIVLSAVVTLHVQREQPDDELRAPQIGEAPAKRKDTAPADAPAVAMRDEKLSRSKEDEAPRAQAAGPKAQEDRHRVQSKATPKPAQQNRAPAGEPPALARAPVEAKPSADEGRFTPEPAPVATAPSPPPAPAAAAAPSPQMQPAAPALGGLGDRMRFDSRALAKREMQVEPPEKMLERIATLRREGRVKEADDLYAEFRRRYPEYKIPEAMRDQVVPR